MGNVRKNGENRIIEQQRSDRNYRTKMGNVRKMGENIIIEQQRSDKNYRTTKKVRSKFRYVFFSHLPRKTEL